MNPLVPGIVNRPPVKEFLRDMVAQGVSRADAKAYYAELPDSEIWHNEAYVVIVTRELDRALNPDQIPGLVWLSIRRQDREPVRDWRDMQTIKNQLLGPECEAVEIYPAESRLVDAANQFHLFGFTDPSMRIPFGFPTRGVTDSTVSRSKQRRRTV